MQRLNANSQPKLVDQNSSFNVVLISQSFFMLEKTILLIANIRRDKLYTALNPYLYEFGTCGIQYGTGHITHLHL